MTEESTQVPPLEERIDFRNRWVAGLLAWLIPGAGHIYQRRFFKGVVYMVCILGIFVWGSSMGEAKAVHLRWDSGGDAKTRQRTLGYLAQVGVGLPALPAVLQKNRFESQEKAFELQRTAGEVIEEFDSEFTGILRDAAGGDAVIKGTISGTLTAAQFAGEEFTGTFKGQSTTGDPVELEVGGMRRYESSEELHIGKRICALEDVTITQNAEQSGRIYSADRRRFFVRLAGGRDGFIEGTIPRPFVNHYQVPIEDEALQRIHGRLGKFYELALVYTWIAGLLNILAVWDCVQGPAYGFGDEPEPDSDDDTAKGSNKTESPTAVAAVADTPVAAAEAVAESPASASENPKG
ncbi:MAG: hypothetical protein O2820_03750 [Planctomycetota bacterium]|nr:hypothetical protein [Planctomycetota bacterium]MDA1248317.1 hypothetical protein [Planctomycetota bacterium]